MHKMIEIRGKRLYVEDDGPTEAPALLYLHGGPGTSCYDFSSYQCERLSGHLRLIALDQRGVLRSDPLSDDEPFGLSDVIEDCEALRTQLSVTKWSVLGHSFGGYLAVRYALAYSDGIDRLLFETPSFDLQSSARSLLRGASAQFAAIGDQEHAEACVAAASANEGAQATWETMTRLLRELGPRRNHLYVHGPDKHFFERLETQAPFPYEWWSRAEAFQRRLYAEGRVFESLIPRLSQLVPPVLLITGRFDLVTPEDQVAGLLGSVPGARREKFEQSSHFTHVEEADRFAATVVAFVTAWR
jgi:proline iminopeptidase